MTPNQKRATQAFLASARSSRNPHVSANTSPFNDSGPPQRKHRRKMSKKERKAPRGAIQNTNTSTSTTRSPWW